MGKRLDQLLLSETTLERRVQAERAQDPREERWYQLLTEIDQLMATGRYTWAEDTLRGIQETIERTHHVTSAQERAVANIEDSRERGFRGGPRRYEGFNGRSR